MNYDAFNDYYYYCHFLSKNHCFFQCKIIFFLKVIRNPASRSLQSIEISLYISCIYEWMKCCQKRRIINEWFILFRDIILLRKSQLVTSYTLKLDANSAQTVLYFFLLMLYRTSTCNIFWLCAVVFFHNFYSLKTIFINLQVEHTLDKCYNEP